MSKPIRNTNYHLNELVCKMNSIHRISPFLLIEDQVRQQLTKANKRIH